MEDCELKEATDRIKLYYPDGEWRAALWDALVISQCGQFTTSGRGNKRAGVDFTYAIEIDIEGEGEGAFYVELDKDSSEIFFHLMLQLYKLSMGRFCLGCLFVNLALLYGI